MALALDYPDAYLVRFCSDDRETRAFAEVDLLPVFIADWTDAGVKSSWRDKAARLKTYILACLENQAAPDDLFTAKLKSYRAEFEATITLARAAQSETGNRYVFSVPLERA